MIKVLLVDDHALVRQGIKSLLAGAEGIQVVAEAESGEQAVVIVRRDNVDVILMDVNMPGIGGIEATRRLLRINPDVKVIALTVYDDDVFPSRVLQAGAMGYLTKGSSLSEMLTAIRKVHLGQSYISPEIAHQLALKHVHDRGESSFDLLSEREHQVMMMITSGLDVQSIAEKLFVSAKTINTYRYRIFEKMQVNNDVELTHMVIRSGLLDSHALVKEED